MFGHARHRVREGALFSNFIDENSFTKPWCCNYSGNLMGDPGARLLGKALQINSHLKNIYYDRNNITLQGYSDLAYAIER